MYIAEAGGGSARTSSISIAVPSVAQTTSYSPRVIAPTTTERTLDEILDSMDPYMFDKQGHRVVNPLYANYAYIKANPPHVGPKKELTTNDILNGILDVISYGSAFASLVPYAPFQVGGNLGYLASNAGRQFLRGNNQAGLAYINQLSRSINRTTRYYQTNRNQMGKTRKR